MPMRAELGGLQGGVLSPTPILLSPIFWVNWEPLTKGLSGTRSSQDCIWAAVATLAAVPLGKGLGPPSKSPQESCLPAPPTSREWGAPVQRNKGPGLSLSPGKLWPPDGRCQGRVGSGKGTLGRVCPRKGVRPGGW